MFTWFTNNMLTMLTGQKENNFIREGGYIIHNSDASRVREFI